MVKVLIARATAVYEKKCTAATPDGTGGLTKIYDSLNASDTALLCPPQDAGGILAQAYPELFSVVLHEG